MSGRKQKSKQQRIEDIELFLEKIKPLLSDFTTLQAVLCARPFLLAATVDPKQPCNREFTTRGSSLQVPRNSLETAFDSAVSKAALAAKLTCATGDCKNAVVIGFEDINIEADSTDEVIKVKVTVRILWKCESAEY